MNSQFTDMKTVLGARASSILYDLLTSHGSGHAFLLPANVCPIVPLTFLKAGVRFEFVDISSKTLHMDLDLVHGLLRAQKGAYGGILYVHTYGDPVTPIEDLAQIKAENPDMLLIDDRCLCVPDLEPDVSKVVDATLYSTGYAKVVDGGFGGFAFLRENVAYKHQALPYRPQDLEELEAGYKVCIGSRQPYHYLNSCWLQTEIEMPLWPEFALQLRNALKMSLEQRRRINAVYNAMIPAEVQLPPSYQLWRYNIRVKDNKRALDAIFQNGLFASAHYASLAGLLGPGSGGIASELAADVINLFNDHHYTPEMAERTARIVVRSL